MIKKLLYHDRRSNINIDKYQIRYKKGEYKLFISKSWHTQVRKISRRKKS
jgi:hypothetical protein